MDRRLARNDDVLFQLPPETTRRLLSEAGFDLVLDELVPMLEPEGEVAFHWVLARR